MLNVLQWSWIDYYVHYEFDVWKWNASISIGIFNNIDSMSVCILFRLYSEFSGLVVGLNVENFSGWWWKFEIFGYLVAIWCHDHEHLFRFVSTWFDIGDLMIVNLFSEFHMLAFYGQICSIVMCESVKTYDVIGSSDTIAKMTFLDLRNSFKTVVKLTLLFLTFSVQFNIISIVTFILFFWAIFISKFTFILFGCD